MPGESVFDMDMIVLNQCVDLESLERVGYTFIKLEWEILTFESSETPKAEKHCKRSLACVN